MIKQTFATGKTGSYDSCDVLQCSIVFITFYDIKNVGFPEMLMLYYIYNITHQVLYLKNNITPQDHLGGGELLYYIYNITNHLLYYIYNINPGVLYYTQH